MPLNKKIQIWKSFEQMGAGALAKAVVHGDVDGGSVMAGQIAGVCFKKKPLKNPKRFLLRSS